MKTQLIRLIIVLLAIGVAFAAYPFIKSMGPNERAENDAILRINISSMTIGEVLHIENSYYLYKESDKVYRLLNGWAPFRGCPIFHVKAGDAEYSWVEERKKYNEISYFIDRCEGTIWELSGKLVKETAFHKERDMKQLKYELVGDHILFHKGKS